MERPIHELIIEEYFGFETESYEKKPIFTDLGHLCNLLVMFEEKINPEITGNASDFEKDLFKLINSYCSKGLSKADLIHKMKYVSKSCKLS
jgi:hypothetical protein